MDNGYLKVRNAIEHLLKENGRTLITEQMLDENINNFKQFGPSHLAILFRPLTSEELTFSDDDWGRMKRELETKFNVQMKKGFAIQGEEQQKRDTQWWSNSQKNKIIDGYWARYESDLMKSLPRNVVWTIDTDTDGILDNVGDPSMESFTRYGMVVGHVQSGKTANYSSLICKAADSGYKFIVVIAGTMNNLRDQTQLRISKALSDPNFPEMQPHLLTSETGDFNKKFANQIAQGFNLDNLNAPVVLVIKKNAGILRNVIKWLSDTYQNKVVKHAMLLIDDESDYASVDTNKSSDDDHNPTSINKNIRELIKLFNKSSYVAYTATPYANIFIDHERNHDDFGLDLFPKDFIYPLMAPTNYFGAKRIFMDKPDEYIRNIDLEEFHDIGFLPLKHKSDHTLTELPASLQEAIQQFLINVSIRNLRKQSKKHNSMLIHITRFTEVHKSVASLVQDYFNELKKSLLTYGNLAEPEKYCSHLLEIKKLYNNSKEFSWELVVVQMAQIVDTIVVRDVHSQSKIKLSYDSKEAVNVIAIGGLSLARGFTLEGLSVSYFIRSTVMYDTLMQMGRWFGYRDGYDDLCKLYTTDEIADHFRFILEASDDLFEQLKEMEEQNKTPEDYGLAVKQHPDSVLQITALNKQRSSLDVEIDMNLAGHSKETAWLFKGKAERFHNYDNLLLWMSNLSEDYSYEKIKNSYLWRDVNKEKILNFIDRMKVFNPYNGGVRSRMPIEFIKQYVVDNDIEWDVALYSGSGDTINITDDIKICKEERQIKDKGEYFEVNRRQVSSGSAEAIALPDVIKREVKSNRRAIRKKLNKPLLMLHILQTKEDPKLVAFGMSFPSNGSTPSKPVRVKINTVKIKELVEGEQGGE